MFNLLHIGYQKTASTFLQKHLFPHLRSRWFDRPMSTLHCRNLIEDDPYRERTFATYLSEQSEIHQKPGIISFESLSGHIWEGSHSARRTAERLAQVAPDSIVLVVVRSQPSMLVALYGQYINEGGTGSLAGFLSGDLAGIELDLSYLDFASLVDQYRLLFPKVVVLPYENLRDSPMPFLSEICDLVGSPFVDPPTTRENPTASAIGAALLRVNNRALRRSAFNPDPPLPVPGSRLARTQLQRLQFGPSLWERHRPEAERFCRRFADSNAQLQQTCTWRLDEYDYPLQ